MPDDFGISKTIATTSVGGVVTYLIWVFKSSVTRATNAMALSKELLTRVEKLEKTQAVVQDMQISTAEIKTKVDNIENAMRRIESYMLENR